MSVNEAAGVPRRQVLLRMQVIGAAILLVVLAVAIGAASLLRSRADADARAEARAASLSVLMERSVSSLLERAAVALGTTVAVLEREAAGAGIATAALWPTVDAATALVPAISRIGIFDAQGRQVCGEPAARCLHLDVSDRDYFRALRAQPQSQPQLYGPYENRVDGQLTVILARSLAGPGGRFGGVVIALIPVRNLVELLVAADLGDSGSAALRGEDLTLLGYSRPVGAAPPTAPAPELRRAVLESPQQGRFRGVNPLDGIEREAAYRRLPGHPLYVVVGLATRDFLATWRNHAAWMLAFFAAFVAATALIARLVLRVAEDRWRIQQLYDDAPCGYHSLDAAGRFLRVNATELGWLGCRREQVLGRLGPVDFFSPQDVESFRSEYRAFVESGHAEGLEYELHGRDGRVRRVLVSASAVRDRGGRFVMSNSVMHDITELHEARGALQRLAGELESRVAQRTQDLRSLAAELDAAETRERRQLARDLHDDLGQTLAAARLHLEALGRAAPQQVHEVATRVAQLIEQANRATRSLAAQLAPPMLDDLGLPEALEWLGEEIQRSYGLKVSVVDDGQPKPLSPEARSILYRATRELLINAAKHARAEAAEVELERAGDTIVVRVRDSGIGFDPAAQRAGKGQGLGLPSVHERLSFIGGSAEVTSIPGDGTLVTLSAPLAAQSGEA